MYSLFLFLNKIKKVFIIIKTKIFKIKTFFILFVIKSG